MTAMASQQAFGSNANTYSNALLAQGDKIVESVPLLSAQSEQFLKYVRNTAEKACTGGLTNMAGPESCDVYSQGYVDASKYFTNLEKKIDGELRIGEDMKLQAGKTESGEAAKVIEIACDGSGPKDAARGVSTFDFPEQKYSVVAVLNNAETCDGVKPNFPSEGVLQIDSRNKQECNFYFVCGAKIEASSQTAIARRSSKTFRAPSQIADTSSALSGAQTVSNGYTAQNAPAAETLNLSAGSTGFANDDDDNIIQREPAPPAQLAPMLGYLKGLQDDPASADQAIDLTVESP